MQPMNDKDGCAVFNVQALIVVGNHYLMFNEDELSNLFVFLRSKKKFRNAEGTVSYREDVKNDFTGTFWLDKIAPNCVSLLFMNSEGEIASTGALHSNDIINILKNEQLINDRILQMKVEKNEFINELDAIVRECDGCVEQVKFLSATSRTMFWLEMVSNHKHFFVNYLNHSNRGE